MLKRVGQELSTCPGQQYTSSIWLPAPCMVMLFTSDFETGLQRKRLLLVEYQNQTTVLESFLSAGFYLEKPHIGSRDKHGRTLGRYLHIKGLLFDIFVQDTRIGRKSVFTSSLLIPQGHSLQQLTGAPPPTSTSHLHPWAYTPCLSSWRSPNGMVTRVQHQCSLSRPPMLKWQRSSLPSACAPVRPQHIANACYQVKRSARQSQILVC